MKGIATAVLIGIVLGAGGYWAWHGSYRPPAIQPEIAQQEREGEAPERIEPIIQGKLEAFELHADSIRDELRQTGRVVRRRARDPGDAVIDTGADAIAATTIKSKLAAHPDLSAFDISVDTTAGVVTLSGVVDSNAQIARAMLLALETENVHQVVSTIQVRLPNPIPPSTP